MKTKLAKHKKEQNPTNTKTNKKTNLAFREI